MKGGGDHVEVTVFMILMLFLLAVIAYSVYRGATESQQKPDTVIIQPAYRPFYHRIYPVFNWHPSGPHGPPPPPHHNPHH